MCDVLKQVLPMGPPSWSALGSDPSKNGCILDQGFADPSNDTYIDQIVALRLRHDKWYPNEYQDMVSQQYISLYQDDQCHLICKWFIILWLISVHFE